MAFIAFITTALAVFVRSLAVYEVLKSINILQLPSRLMLQGAFLHEAGACSESISKQVESYRDYINQCEKEGKLFSNQMGHSYLTKSKLLVEFMESAYHRSCNDRERAVHLT